MISYSKLFYAIVNKSVDNDVEVYIINTNNNANGEATMEQLIAKARTKSTANIKMAITMMGGKMLPTAETMTRAALIEVFIEREGLEAGDALMDQIGL